MDKRSPNAKDFSLFKHQLYQMYQIQHRTVWEHELYSFKIEREHIKLLYNANEDFLIEVAKANSAKQMLDHSFLKGKVYQRKLLNPNRAKGLGAFAFAYCVYS